MVTIVHIPKDNERGWGNTFRDGMQKYLGKEGRIVSVESEYRYGMHVRLDDGYDEWYWPYFSLQKEGQLPTGEILSPTETVELGKPATLVEGDGKTIIIFGGKAMLAGQFTKPELEKIIASPGW